MNRRSSRMALVVLTIMTISVCSVSAALARGPMRSPLPGYPRFHGVLLVHDNSAASVAREQSIKSALGTAGGKPTANCPHPESLTGDLCYWGGPVVGEHKVHLIFWEGEAVQGHPISAKYREAIELYFKDVAARSGSTTNVYAVQTQYGDLSGKGRYQVTFEGAASDVYIDKNALPTSGSASKECVDKEAAAGVCITDKDLQGQVELARAAENGKGHHWEASMHDIYFVFTPAKVGSCFYGAGEGTGEANACAFEAGGYCAYHSGVENGAEELEPPLYANIPDAGGVEGCDSFQHPNGAEGVDATLDATSHEHNETISDPLGTGWLDLIGQEVGDKCLPPETFDIYGGLLGGSLVAGTAFNQEIGTDRYWLQREWSNSATGGEGRCVTRMLHTAFTVQPEARAGVPVIFNGSASGESGDPATYWVWDFGDEVQVGTPQSSVSHTYGGSGIAVVTLTAYDAAGNSNTSTLEVPIGPAPPPIPPPAPITIREVLAPGHVTAAQLATKLGLPANGKKLSGNGPFSFGRAACPPACGVTLQLYAKVTMTSHGHSATKLVLIGSSQVAVAAKALKSLSLSLNAKGKQLLHKLRTLSCRLLVTVEGQEGGTWQIARTLTLKR